MKLKFTNVLLAAAISFGTVVGFSSCKDTENDMFVGVESQYAALKNKVDALQASLDDYAKKADVIAADQALQDQIDGISDVINGQGGIKDEIAAIQGDIDAINDVLDTLDETYVDWDTYNTKVEEIEGRLDQVEADIEALKKEIENINTYLTNIDKRVSSIELQLATSPAYGALNTPFGVKSLALFNFYGEIGENHMGLAAGRVYAGETAGALGTLYFSVNPTDLDLADYTVELVKSNGETNEAVELSAPEASDEVFNFGLSRADETLVWKVDATTADPEALAIDLQVTKEDVKGILKSRNIASILDIPELVKQVLKDNGSMPAYALKLTWEEVDTVTGENVSRSAVSEFAIMANTFEPFSYQTLADVHGPELPMLPDLDGLKEKYDAFVDEIKGEVHINLNNATIDINTSSVTLTVYDNATPPNAVGTVNADDLVDLVNQIKAGVESIPSDMAGDINNQLEDIIDSMAVKAWNKTNGRIGDIYNLVTKAFNKLSDLIYSPNLALQPVCFVKNAETGELCRLSEVSTLPSEIKAGAATVIATSWTGELLAPSYMKEFADDQKLGNENQFEVTIAAGDNVFVYKTIDFHGVEVIKTYYVKGI